MIFLLAFTAHAEDGLAIAKRLEASDAGYHDMVAEVEMDLVSAGGARSQRRLTLSTLERDPGDYSLLRFSSPPDVAGTALLSQPGASADKQWLYLPVLRRSQRIAGGSRTGAFVGSEFSYEDVGGSSAVDHTWTLEGEEPCGETVCHRLLAIPRNEGSGYRHRRVWIEQEPLRLHRIEFVDRSGERLKTLTYSDYERIGGRFWRARTWVMENHQTGRSTRLRFASIELATGLDDTDFAPSVLR